MIVWDPAWCLLGAALVLLVPMRWLLSAITAALVHEAAHILTVILFGGHVRRIYMFPGGCRIHAAGMGDMESFFSILAGPAASIALGCFRRRFPLIAAIGMIQGIFNLLPVLPLDGGRLLQLLLHRFCPRRAKPVMTAVRYAAVLTAAFFGLRAIFQIAGFQFAE